MMWAVAMLFFVFWIQDSASFSATQAWLTLVSFIAVVGFLGASVRRRPPTAS